MISRLPPEIVRFHFKILLPYRHISCLAGYLSGEVLRR